MMSVEEVPSARTKYTEFQHAGLAVNYRILRIPLHHNTS